MDLNVCETGMDKDCREANKTRCGGKKFVRNASVAKNFSQLWPRVNTIFAFITCVVSQVEIASVSALNYKLTTYFVRIKSACQHLNERTGGLSVIDGCKVLERNWGD